MRTIRLAFALAAFLLAVTASRPALADVTIQGTVGEIGLLHGKAPGDTRPFIRFKMTDANQTATCVGSNPNNQQFNGISTGAKYAWFDYNELQLREWYAALLVSKKGAMISCTINDANTCQVTSCTLP